MKPNKNKNLLVVLIGLITCVVVAWFSTTTQGGEKTYEVQPQLILPEYRSDTARAIDAYERLMDRYMSLTERNLTGISTDLKSIAKKLDSVDGKLTELSARMARIEKALGIAKPEPAHAKDRKKFLRPGVD